MRYNSIAKPNFSNGSYNSKNISKAYYTTGDNLIDDVTYINKLILAGTPIETVSALLQKLLKKQELFSNYKNMAQYVNLKSLLISVDQSYLYNDFKDRLQNILDELARLRAECEPVIQTTNVELDKTITVQDVSIKREYIIYIQMYGFPEDGNFLPSKLDEIKLSLNYV